MPDRAGVGGEVTGDEYMTLLLERQAEHMASRPAPPDGVKLAAWIELPPPLEMFVLPGDEDLFTPPKHVPAPKRETTPRTYKPASHWRALREKAQADLDRLTGGTSDDPAVVNLSHTSRSRAARNAGKRRMAALERDVEKAARLMSRIEFLDHKVLMADARERK